MQGAPLLALVAPADIMALLCTALYLIDTGILACVSQTFMHSGKPQGCLRYHVCGVLPACLYAVCMILKLWMCCAAVLPLRLVVRSHKDALLEMRTFWQLLLHAKVRFEDLTRAARKIDSAIKSADRTYR